MAGNSINVQGAAPFNTSIGYDSISNTGAAQCTAVGYQAGNNYTTTETNNICIGYGVLGTTGESNTMRLGDPGTIDACYIAGVANTPVTSAQVVLTSSGTNQIGAISDGNPNQFLQTNGSGSLSWANSIQMNQQIFTSNGTYTPTSGMLYAFVEVVGAGGGGGGAEAVNAGQQSVGGGGGGGAYACSMLSAAVVGASQAVTIGAQGTAGSGATMTNGAAGGISSFGTLVVANGGLGAVTGAASANFTTVNFGAGGVATAGDLRIPGESGGVGIQTFLTAGVNYVNIGGYGGGSHYSPGSAESRGPNTVGFIGSDYGGGGGGASNAAAASPQGAVDGGVGSSGLVIITEYIS